MNWEPIISALAVVAGQVVLYFKNKKSTTTTVESAKDHLCEDAHMNTDKIVRRLNEQAQAIENLSENFKTMKVAFHAVDTSFKNTQLVIANVSDKVDKQGRLLVEMAKFKMSEKTTIPGGNKNEG